jgi:hypothetical protein
VVETAIVCKIFNKISSLKTKNKRGRINLRWAKDSQDRRYLVLATNPFQQLPLF